MHYKTIVSFAQMSSLPILSYAILSHNKILLLPSMILLLAVLLLDLFSFFLTAKEDMQVHSFLYPFSDKIMIYVLLLIFTLEGTFSFLFLLLFFIRDLIAGWIRILASRDDVSFTNISYAKIITTLQFLLIFSLFLKQFSFSSSLLYLLFFVNSLIFFIFLFGIVSLIHFALHYHFGLKQLSRMEKTVSDDKLIILANKRSGGYHDRYRRHLLKRFARRRKASIYYLSSEQNMYKKLDPQTLKANKIVIAGGDGSFESALNYSPFYRKNVGFFPLGTGNSYYSYFYRGKRFEYLRSRFHFRQVPLDILEIEWENGKRQTGFLGIGADAEVIRSTSHQHRSFVDYVLAAAKVVFGPSISYSLMCTVDDKKYYWKNCFNLILGKIPYIGFGLRSLLGKMKPHDGFITGLAHINTHSSFFNKGLRIWTVALTQLGFVKSPLFSLRGKQFKIESKKPFPLHAGGEFLGYTKWLKVKVARTQNVLMI